MMIVLIWQSDDAVRLYPWDPVMSHRTHRGKTSRLWFFRQQSADWFNTIYELINYTDNTRADVNGMDAAMDEWQRVGG